MSQPLVCADGPLLLKAAPGAVSHTDWVNRFATYRARDPCGDCRWPAGESIMWVDTLVHETYANGAVVDPVPAANEASATNGEHLTAT